MTPKPANILFLLSGSIAAYKACDAISRLVQRGHRVRTVATHAALKFVGPATLEGLTGQKVATELFEAGAALDHIALARWADVLLVCPATANTLNRMAAGIADDLPGALLLAYDLRKPWLIAPAMNPAMWQHPATRASVARLGEWGGRFVCGTGRTACGEVGEGRMAEPEEIVAAVEGAVAAPARQLRVLITSGGTSEPIDGVRVLTNTSTGATGAGLATYFARRGHVVSLLRANQAQRPDAPCREELFETFADLDAALTQELATHDYDAVIHAAAVGDFSVAAIEVGGVVQSTGRGKLSSDVAPTLKLRRNPKLLDALRARSRNPAIRIVAFKLTREASEGEVAWAVCSLFATGVADFVVHNDLAARADAFPADIWSRDGKIARACPDRSAIAPALEDLLLRVVGPVTSSPSPVFDA